MWFKNLQLFRFTKPFELPAETLDEVLAKRPFRTCGPLELASAGWSAPLGGDATALVHSTNGYLMLCAKREEKILPPAVINELLAERVAEIEESQMRKIRRKEKDEMRDNLIAELLPRAFSRSARTYAYIDAKEGWLIVDSASRKRAEELVELLRKTIGTLPVVPPGSRERPGAVLTDWLRSGNCGDGFDLEDECELRGAEEDGGVVRCRKMDLGSNEIQIHLEAGKEAARVAVTWRDRISLVLSDDFSIKRLRFLDLVQDEADAAESEDPAARFDTDFAIMSLELARLLPELFDAFGGVADEEDAPVRQAAA